MLLLGLGAAFGSSARAAQPPGFEIAPPPAWVWPVTADSAKLSKPDSSGISYVLVDQQENVAPRSSYYHEACLISSDHGVQNGSDITVSFDPSYQKLTFHFIRIIRDGTTIDRLDRSKIQLFQRETEMESFLYDGSFTAQCQLEDVRVNDVIEYAYTIDGDNPVMKGKYFDGFATEWSVPVHRAVLRIVRPTERPMHVRIKNREIEPKITTREGRTEWLWEDTDIPPRRMDNHTPLGYNPYGSVQVSEFGDWSEVVEWAIPLYRVDEPLSEEMQAQVNRLNLLPDREERILAALRFVQEEIRYLGIESGVGSHQPTAPSEVLRRRFGDCKDKTLLLATLLKHCDVTATPALVSSYHRQQMSERLPSPTGFNHVILHVEVNKTTYWLDATRSSQRGPLSQIYVTNYGSALLLRPGIRHLSLCLTPLEAFPRKKIMETFKVARPGEDARLEVVSEFHGYSAEVQRGYFKNHNGEEIEKNYVQFYARRYPRIRAEKPAEYEEIAGANSCRIRESYVIPALWQWSEEKKHHFFELYPSEVSEEMGTPGATERKDPLALRHPVHVTQVIRAEMFEDWPLKTERDSVSNAFFTFRHEAKATGRDVEILYAYQSLADRVAVAELASYDSTLRRLEDNLGYNFTHRSTGPAAAGAKGDAAAIAGKFNWPIAVLSVFVMLIGIVMTVVLYFVCRRLEPLPPSLENAHLDGIGGWLILVAFGSIVRPFIYIYTNSEIYPSVFELETWRALTLEGSAAFHPLWMPVLLFEFFFNAYSFLFSILLLVLFFQKKRAWPYCFILFFIYIGIGIIIDAILCAQIPAVAEQQTETGKEIVKTIMAACIWIPYAIHSKRVKATFRR